MPDNYIPINLPSKCLAYTGVDASTIQIRTLKGRDEKLIAEISTDNFDKKANLLLGSVLKGIEPTKLTIGDRLALILWETINSYGKDFPIESECEHCWQKSEYNIDLSKLDNVTLPDDYKQPYEVKLSDSGKLVKLRLLTVDDLLKVSEIDKLGQNVWLYRYALSIVDDKGIWDRVEFLEELSVRDLATIRAFHEKFIHGPKMETTYECPKCGGGGVLPIPFRLEMLLPYGKRLNKYLGNAV
jgi:hypothetical protein